MKKSIVKMGIEKAVSSAIRRTTGAQEFTQDVAIFCLGHIVEHGDWTHAVNLVQGITKCKGAKSSKLRQYFEAMMSASLVYNKDEKQWQFIYDEGKGHKDINLEMAEAVKWYDFKAESGDTTKTLEQIAKQVGKMLDASLETDKVTADEATQVNNLLADLLEAREHAERVARISAVA